MTILFSAVCSQFLSVRDRKVEIKEGAREKERERERERERDSLALVAVEVFWMNHLKLVHDMLTLDWKTACGIKKTIRL